jgi:hypothetical protein
MLVLKTSATPTSIDQATLRSRISRNEREALTSGTLPIISVVVFNRIMCTEFGLTMYVGDERSGSLLERVQVTA